MKLSTRKLRPLTLISELIGLSVPNVLNYTGLPVLYLIYVLLLLAGLLFVSVQTLIYKIRDEYERYLSTVVVLDFAYNLLLLTCNATSLLQATFFRRRRIVGFFRRLHDFDRSFDKDFGAIECRARFFHVELVAVHAVTLSYLAYVNYYITRKTATFACYYAIHATVNAYLLTVGVLQIYYYVASVNERLYNVNQKSRRYVEQYKLMKRFARNLHESKLAASADFSPHLKSHEQLCDLFDALSATFGWQILFLRLIAAVALLRSANVALKLLFDTFRIDDDGGLTLAYYLSTSVLLATFLVLIGLSCGQTSGELRKIAAIGYDFYVDFGVHPKTTQEEVISRQLRLMFAYSRSRSDKISAAGFFDVDCDLLYATVGAAAGYVVVCLQFP